MLLWIIAVICFYMKASALQGCGIGKSVYRDCQDYLDNGFTESGVYHVTPIGTYTRYTVYCDMMTDNGGWLVPDRTAIYKGGFFPKTIGDWNVLPDSLVSSTEDAEDSVARFTSLVFQRRQDGSVEFYLDWENYQKGFGNVSGEHWLGNLPLKTIINQGHYILRIDLEDFEGQRRFATYKSFRINDSTDKYRLTISGYSGNAGDAMEVHQGMVFSTKDSDSTAKDCTELYRGGWWYADCHRANLNGPYLNGYMSTYADGIIWLNFRGYSYSLKKVEMKVRRR